MQSNERGGRRRGAGRPLGAPTRVVRLPVPLADWAQRLAGRRVRRGDVASFHDIEARSDIKIPLMVARAVCGFPSPADDYMERPLDFNELLIRNPPATFAVRIQGESMTGAGIFPGDLAVIDRSETPTHGRIVLAIVSGEFTVKTYWNKGGRIVLHPENPAFSDLIIAEGMDFEVWGVLTSTVRSF